MSSSSDLYIFREKDSTDWALPLIEALHDARLVSVPVVHCSPFHKAAWRDDEDDERRIFHPNFYGNLNEGMRSLRDWAEVKKAASEAVYQPTLLIFRELDRSNAELRSQFFQLAGTRAECALGIYILPEPENLTFEFDEYQAPDEPVTPARTITKSVRIWAHFQGECAPWEDQFPGSILERVFANAWGRAHALGYAWG